MSDGWGSIASLLGLRDQREQAKKDRRHGGLRDIASMIYGRKEREAGEAFETSERIGGEIAASDAAIKANEFEAGLSEREHGYRVTEEATRFDNEGLLNEQQRTFQIGLNDQMIKANQALQDAGDEDARKRALIEYGRELKLIGVEYENTWGDFENPLQIRDWDDPSGEKFFEVRSPPEMDSLRAWLLERARLAQIALEKAGPPDEEKGQGLAIFEREFAKLQAARPDIWADTQGWYVTVDQKTYDELSRMLNDNLTQMMRDGDIDSIEDMQSIARMLGTYVSVPPADPGDGDAGGGEGSTNEVWNYFKDHGRLPDGVSADEVLDNMTKYGSPEMEALADQGFMGTLSAEVLRGGQWLLGWIPGLNRAINDAARRVAAADGSGVQTPPPPDQLSRTGTQEGDYPEGISTAEQQLYDLLMQLAGGGQQYQPLIQNLIENDVTPPGNDPMSFIRQMLSGVQQ